MRDEMKEFLFVWIGILAIVGLVSKFVHGLYIRTVLSFLEKYMDTSLAMTLFWIGWLFFLLLVYNIYVNITLYDNWDWEKNKIKDWEEKRKRR
ncbi:MAG: hypothetical protein PHH35_01375 [Candidatus Pacebacteria bacterium]|jgi:uncharacterized membrane protein YedE/YeeE|nr:hypothetical protein [Candidatus Paceibacterota bacterium]